MNDIQYIGEHLWVGNLGHFFIILGFVSPIIAIIAYFFAEKKKGTLEGDSWKKIGRIAFSTHGISVFSIIGLIFFIMTQRYYEYAYAFNHVSDDLPSQYILSAFWEGQEGSFLLWMFWHVVLGFILLARSKSWENGVMLFLAAIQLILSSLLLGVYVGDVKIGINPFVLLRHTKEMMDIPIFAQADYVSKIQGTGLNPLLQNYWMTIHPPTLFLGFASVAVPFCYAAAALWTKRFKEWLKPVLPWALFSVAVLGTGILMGGAWAYEALSFGGYWAWDPVENMSLVPWLILVAGLHMNLVARTTGHSYKSTFLFYLFGFIMIFYSTFLTRSGILGESSVHAFTELGLEWHLVLALAAFTGIGLFQYFWNRKSIPVPAKEEATSSKEFWMFIGSLVLLISTLLISLSTSIPVINAIASVQPFNGICAGIAGITPELIPNGGFVNGILGSIHDIFNSLATDGLATPAEPIEHYNKHQIWVGLFIGLLSGVAQFLRFNERNFSNWQNKFFLHTGIALVLSSLLTYLTYIILEPTGFQYHLLVFACWYAIISNLDYVITVAKGNLKMLGSAMSHIGFGLMLIGSVISGINKHHISTNKFAQEGLIEGFTAENYEKNVLLIKNLPLPMKGYEVTYSSDTLIGYNRYFTVDYAKRDMETGEITERFSLQPNIIYEKTFQKVAASNPSTKRYWNKDVFTHVSSLPRAETDQEYAKELEDSIKYFTYKMLEGDTFQTAEIIGTFVGIDRKPTHKDYEPEFGDFAVGLNMTIFDKKENRTFDIKPMAVVRGSRILRFPEFIPELSVKVKLTTDIFDELFVREDQLEYEQFTVKKGEIFNHKGTTFTFNGFGTAPKSDNYEPEAEDKAFNAIIDFEKDGKSYTGKPIYFIRGGTPYNIKDELPKQGLHFKIADVNPKEQNITLLVAQQSVMNKLATIEAAEEVPSGEYIVLEAIVFPGINLFWIGSIVMLLGAAVAGIRRAMQK